MSVAVPVVVQRLPAGVVQEGSGVSLAEDGDALVGLQRAGCSACVRHSRDGFTLGHGYLGCFYVGRKCLLCWSCLYCAWELMGVAWGISYARAGLDFGCWTLVGWTALRFMSITCYASS